MRYFFNVRVAHILITSIVLTFISSVGSVTLALSDGFARERTENKATSPNPPRSGTRTNDLINIVDFSGCHNETKTIDVRINTIETQVDAINIRIAYDTGMLSYVSCARGSLDPGWGMFGCNEPTPGEIRIAGFAYPGYIPVGSTGSLVQLTFTVNCSTCVNGEYSAIEITYLEDDLAGWQIQNGTFTYICPTQTPTVSPTPTITPTPTISPTATFSPSPTGTPEPGLTPTGTPTIPPNPIPSTSQLGLVILLMLISIGIGLLRK